MVRLKLAQVGPQELPCCQVAPFPIQSLSLDQNFLRIQVGEDQKSQICGQKREKLKFENSLFLLTGLFHGLLFRSYVGMHILLITVFIYSRSLD